MSDDFDAAQFIADRVSEMLGTNHVVQSESPLLTWETVRNATLPLVHYVAREMFDPDEPVKVVDMSDSDSNSGVITYYVVYCHPLQVPDLERELDGVARFEPLPVVEPDESERDE